MLMLNAFVLILSYGLSKAEEVQPIESDATLPQTDEWRTNEQPITEEKTPTDRWPITDDRQIDRWPIMDERPRVEERPMPDNWQWPEEQPREQMSLPIQTDERQQTGEKPRTEEKQRTNEKPPRGQAITLPAPSASELLLLDAVWGDANATNGNATNGNATNGGVASKLREMWHCVRNDSRPPTIADVRFHLYTRRNRNKPEEIFETLKTSAKTTRDDPPPPIRSAYLNASLPTKIVVHGYTQSSLDDTMQRIKRAFLARFDVNVILVDWRDLARPPCYNYAVRYSKYVGSRLALLVDNLPVPLATIHVVGFSLGAHVAGHASNWLTRGSLSHVTGLDPARPYFMTDDRWEKLDYTDARFVEVIHTDAGFLGQSYPVGHVDYYPNGGSKQPGCAEYFCNHDRAPEYYVEALTTAVPFRAVGCTSWRDYKAGACDGTADVRVMGGQEPAFAVGMYFLHTERDRPFAIG